MTFASAVINNRFLGYVLTAIGVVSGSLLISPFRELLDLSNIALLYVLGVVAVGVKFGRGPAIFCGLAGSLAFAFVFVPPHFSLAITEWQNFLTALIMLIVALIVGHMTAELHAYTEAVEERAFRSSALNDVAQELAGQETTGDVEQATLKFFINTMYAIEPEFLTPDQFDQQSSPLTGALISKCLEQQHMVTKPSFKEGQSFVILPLVASTGVQAVLQFTVTTEAVESRSYCELAETVASFVAVVLERAHFAEMARSNELKSTAQNLRLTILSSLSHDIRTPLTSLVGMADVLMMGRNLAAEKQASLLSSMRSQALSIRQLVSNLLDMAQLQSGKVELNMVWQPVEEVIGATLKQAADITCDRDVDLRIEDGLPPLRFDAVLIERALWNLVENACKYSPEQTQIRITASRQGEFVDVTVSDRGPGLPPGKEENIFGLFQRGNPESCIPGAGLGLAIARDIAVAHRGQLFANNREGGGSSFHLLLPIQSPPVFQPEE
ncbi:ATP-binding protein [Propionivibrio limicola]|uniref:ATP-binding protein n=1 Tax=Propionivibrio limicola TaxID=167645 RepID=UPI001292387A|nr:ATP-binding protein [Propionivibrio limicola]